MVEFHLRVVIAVIIIILLGFRVKWLLNRITGTIEELPHPENVDKKVWQEAIGKGIIEKGVHKYLQSDRCLGIIESLISLIAFWTYEYVMIAGWLAFKVAAKWEVWKNIIQVPISLGKSTSELSYLKAKNAWGTWLLHRFLIGTLINILIGFVAYYIGNLLFEII